ncbi:S1 family peptidase [Promicromonospora thailandica]|uniref:Trypsin-like peptidase n=1 Tax=Promicromonospora thailandica TaxID=765201 RepID=A0A9X2JW11_9MICO|nr:S1 family peptidase [Promicromonospora thailandica]MCP2265052.1 hypothetical protein [Promicromonospora thailandica]BFF19894.1 hypothetical protein GCM10025730_34150 [Promicromonospora thailandica]
MDRDQARKLKEQLAAFARDLAERQGVVATPRSLGAQSAQERVSEAADVVRAPTLALGLVPQGEGGFGIAVRYRLGVPRARSIVRKVLAEVGPEVDVRRTGRIRPVSELGPRPPAPTSLADGDTDRRRPLRPGVSIGHVGVTAGTLGAFVTRPGGDDDGALYALSNYHVLAGSPDARPGDIVLQPGPADGGLAPGDRIGELAQVVDLDPLEPAVTDAAIARLDRVPVDFEYPVGRVVKTARALGGEIVGKVGRTTAVTRGRVTAIELDDVIVGYEDLGALGFDDQIEIESLHDGPFSRGGDSGALVYREDGVALGLLFAGSESGGRSGKGLTYANPIDRVLEILGVELAREAPHPFG